MIHRQALACAVLLIACWPAPAQNAPGGPPLVIQPTVTPAMGDMGGKFFGKVPDSAKTRHYYVAAEPEQWTYAPDVSEPVCGRPVPPSAESNKQPVSKLRYVEYTDATFKARVASTPRLGILGPVLRGCVGEYLAVTFLNRTSGPLSMHPHGVRYDKDSEGAYYPPEPGRGAAIARGGTFTYVWYLDESSGPMPDEPSSKAWLYHSHVMGDGEVNQGLVGCIIVTDPKRAREDGTPKDVDREMATLYLIFDESGLGADAEAYERPVKAGGPPPKPWVQVQELMEIGSRYSINGRTFGNLPGLEMNEGERVRWYLFALGSEQDFHTAHWHGMRVVEEGRRRTDVVELMPASMKVADMQADNPGTWLLHCHVAEHMREGMFTRYIVHSKGEAEADRNPAEAFLGLSHSSLRFVRTELLPDGGLQLEGAVTVFDAFSVFNQAVLLTVGGKAESFKPDRSGVGTVNGCTWRVRNVNPLGVVYGGALAFEVTLAGPAWQDEIKKLKPGDTLPVTLQLGSATHHAEARLTKGR